MTFKELYQERRAKAKETGIVTYDEKNYCHDSYLENGPEHIGRRQVVLRGDLGAVVFSCTFDDTKKLSAEEACASLNIFKPSTSGFCSVRSNVLLYVDAEIIPVGDTETIKKAYYTLIKGHPEAIYEILREIYMTHEELREQIVAEEVDETELEILRNEIARLAKENNELFYRAAVPLALEDSKNILCNFCTQEHYEWDEPPCDECNQGEAFIQTVGSLGFCKLPPGTCYQGDHFKQRIFDFNKKIEELQAENNELKNELIKYEK